MDFESTGTLVAWTQSDRIPANVQGLHPHRIGLIRLDGGPLVLAIIADAQYHEIQLGEKGELVTRRISIESDESLIVYGYKFRPHALNHRSPQD